MHFELNRWAANRSSKGLLSPKLHAQASFKRTVAYKEPLFRFHGSFGECSAGPVPASCHRFKLQLEDFPVRWQFPCTTSHTRYTLLGIALFWVQTGSRLPQSKAPLPALRFKLYHTPGNCDNMKLQSSTCRIGINLKDFDHGKLHVCLVGDLMSSCTMAIGCWQAMPTTSNVT